MLDSSRVANLAEGRAAARSEMNFVSIMIPEEAAGAEAPPTTILSISKRDGLDSLAISNDKFPMSLLKRCFGPNFINKSVRSLRQYSAVSKVTPAEIDERVLNILKAFDKVDPTKVRALIKSFR